MKRENIKCNGECKSIIYKIPVLARAVRERERRRDRERVFIDFCQICSGLLPIIWFPLPREQRVIPRVVFLRNFL